MTLAAYPVIRKTVPYCGGPDFLHQALTQLAVWHLHLNDGWVNILLSNKSPYEIQFNSADKSINNNLIY